MANFISEDQIELALLQRRRSTWPATTRREVDAQIRGGVPVEYEAMAGAIDTPLPQPPSVTLMLLGSKPVRVAAQVRPGDASFDGYPDESLAEWHRRNEQSF